MKSKQLIALTLAVLIAFITALHGYVVGANLTFLALASLAGTRACRRGQLGAAPDTNDVTAELNLNEILDAAIAAFSRTILPLTVFATVFRDVQLRGTDKVEVPYYPLQGSTSKDFAGTYDMSTGAGSNTLTREITVNRRKYQPMSLTGREIARLPMLNAQKLGAMKGEKLAYDVIQDVLSLVTAANFPSVAFTGLSGVFDSDSVVDIRTACGKNSALLAVADAATTNGSATLTSATADFHPSDVGLGISGAGIPAATTIIGVTNNTTITLSANATATAAGVAVTINRPIQPWPDSGRGLIVTPDYDGALLKDANFRRDLTVAEQSTVNTGNLPRVYGFDYGQTAAIPNNGENLVGMATYMSAILAAFSPIEPPPSTRKLMTRYEIATDPNGISIEYREWGNPGTDTDNKVIECNYGFTKGETQAIKRLKSA